MNKMRNGIGALGQVGSRRLGGHVDILCFILSMMENDHVNQPKRSH